MKRGIENLMGVQLHDRRVVTSAQIACMIQRYVSRPPKSGEPESESSQHWVKR